MWIIRKKYYKRKCYKNGLKKKMGNVYTWKQKILEQTS